MCRENETAHSDATPPATTALLSGPVVRNEGKPAAGSGGADRLGHGDALRSPR